MRRSVSRPDSGQPGSAGWGARSALRAASRPGSAEELRPDGTAAADAQLDQPPPAQSPSGLSAGALFAAALAHSREPGLVAQKEAEPEETSGEVMVGRGARKPSWAKAAGAAYTETSSTQQQSTSEGTVANLEQGLPSQYASASPAPAIALGAFGAAAAAAERSHADAGAAAARKQPQNPTTADPAAPDLSTADMASQAAEHGQEASSTWDSGALMIGGVSPVEDRELLQEAPAALRQSSSEESFQSAAEGGPDVELDESVTSYASSSAEASPSSTEDLIPPAATSTAAMAAAVASNAAAALDLEGGLDAGMCSPAAGTKRKITAEYSAGSSGQEMIAATIFRPAAGAAAAVKTSAAGGFPAAAVPSGNSMGAPDAVAEGLAEAEGAAAGSGKRRRVEQAAEGSADTGQDPSGGVPSVAAQEDGQDSVAAEPSAAAPRDEVGPQVAPDVPAAAGSLSGATTTAASADGSASSGACGSEPEGHAAADSSAADAVKEEQLERPAALDAAERSAGRVSLAREDGTGSTRPATTALVEGSGLGRAAQEPGLARVGDRPGHRDVTDADQTTGASALLGQQPAAAAAARPAGGGSGGRLDGHSESVAGGTAGMRGAVGGESAEEAETDKSAACGGAAGEADRSPAGDAAITPALAAGVTVRHKRRSRAVAAAAAETRTRSSAGPAVGLATSSTSPTAEAATSGSIAAAEAEEKTGTYADIASEAAVVGHTEPAGGEASAAAAARTAAFRKNLGAYMSAAAKGGAAAAAAAADIALAAAPAETAENASGDGASVASTAAVTRLQTVTSPQPPQDRNSIYAPASGRRTRDAAPSAAGPSLLAAMAAARSPLHAPAAAGTAAESTQDAAVPGGSGEQTAPS